MQAVADWSFSGLRSHHIILLFTIVVIRGFCLSRIGMVSASLIITLYGGHSYRLITLSDSGTTHLNSLRSRNRCNELIETCSTHRDEYCLHCCQLNDENNTINSAWVQAWYVPPCSVRSRKCRPSEEWTTLPPSGLELLPPQTTFLYYHKYICLNVFLFCLLRDVGKKKSVFFRLRKKEKHLL